MNRKIGTLPSDRVIRIIFLKKRQVKMFGPEDTSEVMVLPRCKYNKNVDDQVCNPRGNSMPVVSNKRKCCIVPVDAVVFKSCSWFLTWRWQHRKGEIGCLVGDWKYRRRPPGPLPSHNLLNNPQGLVTTSPFSFFSQYSKPTCLCWTSIHPGQCLKYPTLCP